MKKRLHNLFRSDKKESSTPLPLGLLTNKKLFFTAMVFFIIALDSTAQIVSVDNFKGRAEVSIPIWQITSGDISLPVSLNYSSAGIKVVHDDAQCGLGWTLNAGGAITRDLKGLPDDLPNKGWMYGNAASLVESFTVANDNNKSTCADEVADNNYISSNFTANIDPEPDVFNVSAPGLSCQIIFDKNHVPRTIPYKDYKIEYTTDIYGINSFTIINENGVRYVFRDAELEYKNVVRGTNDPSAYFNREYDLYATKIYYYSSWNLSSITDVLGNAIGFQYVTSIEPVNGDIEEDRSENYLMEGNGAGGIVKKNNRSTLSKVNHLYISSISGTSGTLTFNYLGGTGIRKRLVSISLPYNQRVLEFTYTGGNDVFLKSVQEIGCEALPPYSFSYKGIDLDAVSNTFPDQAKGWHQDFWGYYNANADTTLTPKLYVYPPAATFPDLGLYSFNAVAGYPGSFYTLPGADRSVNQNTVMTGTLNKIVYPLGGSTSIEYESNDYYDQGARAVYLGGGIRVKKISESDGLSTAKDIVKEYTYKDPVTNLTSGKPITLPSLAFTRAYTGSATGQSYWEYSTVRSENDLSSTSTDIIYGFVTVKQSGIGKITYEYQIPGTHWDLTAPSWAPTVSYVGRASCSSVGDLANGKNTYPYAPNPNYDFDRGLIRSITAYNENSATVSKKEYSYQRTNAPVLIYGLRFDYLDGINTYAKYSQLTSTDELVATEKSTMYDLNDMSKYQENVLTNFYTGNSHKNVTKTTVVNSDGTVNNTYVKYAKDYPVVANGDVATAALYSLIAKNLNPIVEVYSSIIKSGESEKFISGNLTKYKSIPRNNNLGPFISYVPGQLLKFVNNDGITAFQPSQVSGTSFLQDAKYLPSVTYDSYNNLNGLPNTIVNSSKEIKSFLFNNLSNQPFALITNAKYNELATSGADGDNSFIMDFGYVIGEGPYAKGKTVPAAANFQASLKKGNARNYVFSCWLKPTAAGTLTITLINTANLNKTYSLPYVGATAWKYYEIKVPVTEMTSDFTVRAMPSTTSDIGGVLFYPDNAYVSTFTYDEGRRKLSETNSNGVTVYYEYDRIGRLKYVKDQDKNIVRKESYVSYNVVPSLFTPIFSYDLTKTKTGENIPFSVGTANDCVSSVTYNWNFGDGTGVVTNNAAPSHIYTNAGSYVVTVTAVHPLYGSKTSSQTVTITTNSLQIVVCASGVIAVDNCRVDAPLISTCAGFPSDGTHTYFNITELLGCPAGTTYTYLWEQSYDNGNSWVSVGTGTGYNSGSFNPRNNRSTYWIRCTINSSCGKVGVSNIATFIGYNSTPDCN